MIVIDTNVLSELGKPEPEADVVAWIDAQADLALAAVTVGKIMFGIRRLPAGRRRESLHASMVAIVDEDLAGRVLPYDRAAAEEYGEIVTTRLHAGQPISMADAQIAATCRAHGAAIATRNVGDFLRTGINVINPWTRETHSAEHSGS